MFRVTDSEVQPTTISFGPLVTVRAGLAAVALRVAHGPAASATHIARRNGRKSVARDAIVLKDFQPTRTLQAALLPGRLPTLPNSFHCFIGIDLLLCVQRGNRHKTETFHQKVAPLSPPSCCIPLP